MDVRTALGLTTEGTAPVGGIPPTPGAASGTAAIVGQQNPTKTAVWVWAGLLGVLFLFHVGGAHLG